MTLMSGSSQNSGFVGGGHTQGTSPPKRTAGPEKLTAGPPKLTAGPPKLVPKPFSILGVKYPHLLGVVFA